MTSSDIRIAVHDLLRRPGSRHVVHVEVDVGGLSISTSGIPDGTTVATDITLDSVQDGIVLSGYVQIPWVGDCRRCLESTTGVVDVDVHEVYRTEPLEDMLPIEDESIDVTAALRDAALLSLPIAPLCRIDCGGPSPDEFPVGTADDDSEVAPDPRWAALEGLRFDSGSEED